MKKFIPAAIAAMSILLAVPAYASAESTAESAATDAVSSASVNDFYTDYAISGDELMDAINSFNGFYAVATANEDGTPQLAYFVYSMLKEGDTYYLMLGLEENQTRSNLERTGTATAMYAVRPTDDAQPQYAVSGARMDLELVTDEKLAAELNESGYDTAMFCAVKAVSSLG